MNLQRKSLNLVIIVSVVSMILCTLAGCFGGSLSKKVNKSLKTVHSATLNVAVKDGETEVYSLNKSISFIDGGANVITVTKKLNPNTFGFKEETLSEFVENTTGKDVISLNLNKEIFKSEVKDGDVVNVVVSQSKANKFFGVTEAKANSDITVKFVFAKKKLQSITISYLLTSGKTVEMSATYTY